MMTQEEKKALVRAQIEVGKRTRNGEKLSTRQIHEIVMKYKKEVQV